MSPRCSNAIKRRILRIPNIRFVYSINWAILKAMKGALVMVFSVLNSINTTKDKAHPDEETITTRLGEIPLAKMK